MASRTAAGQLVHWTPQRGLPRVSGGQPNHSPAFDTNDLRSLNISPQAHDGAVPAIYNPLIQPSDAIPAPLGGSQQFKRIYVDPATAGPSTEETWRSLYAAGEDIFFGDPDLFVECNSAFWSGPRELRKLTSCRPDCAIGVARHVAPHLRACATGRLSSVFAYVEEKRLGTDRKDESKLLCVMAGQMKRFKAHFQLPWASTAPNGVPMPVGVGVLRGAAEWKVGIMWRGDDDQFSWKWIIEGALTRPGDFMHYTTFMFRLFCYGQLFKEAMQQLIEQQRPSAPAEDDDQLGGESEEYRDDEQGEEEARGERSHGDNQDPNDNNVYQMEDLLMLLLYQGDTASNTDNNMQGACNDQENTGSSVSGLEVLSDRLDDIVELIEREDGTLVVRKTYYEWAHRSYKREVQAYTLLQDYDITPPLLGHWCDKTTGNLILELEYQPSTVYTPQSLPEVASIMVGLCKALACLHGAGLLHKDIKMSNILTSTTTTNEVKVKLIDFEFVYKTGDDDAQTSCYTSGYIPPELLKANWAEVESVVKNQPLGASDMFAAGIILLELLLGCGLAGMQQETTRIVTFLEELMTNTTKYRTHQRRLARFVAFLRDLGIYGDWPEEDGPLDQDKGDALDLLHRLTCRSLDARFTASQALDHPFLTPTQAES